MDDVSVGQKVYKGAVPYANPQEIQRRQKEMQERKMVEERREQENMERERTKREEEERQERERQERERQEHERIKREELARREREQKERERIQREELEQQERRERERIDREQQERRERERIDREQQERRERERIDREQQERRERERIDREQQERRERERIDQERREREKIDREQQERRERERIEELERKKREEWEKKERERVQREEMERKEREELDDMSRQEREFEMKLEQKRRDKEKRLQELRRQLEEEEAEAERIEREYRERMNKKRDERMDQQRNPVAKEPKPPAVQNTQVHYVNDNGREMEDTKAQAGESRPARRVDYGKRQQLPNDSMDIDPVEVERQFQQRLAQETRNDEADGGFVTVIRVPVQQENWDQQDGEYVENTRKRMERVEIEGANEDLRTRPETDADDRPRARVDRQRNEDERYRKEIQQRREQDEQLMRDFQKQRTFEGDGYRKQPVGAGGEQPVYPRPPEWEKEDELRRQREEDDRLREARANQLRNRCIEQPEEDESNRNTSYANGRTKRVKFATVRTEITQPSPDTEQSKAGVKFVHDGKVADSEDEEDFRRPPPPEDEDEAPPHPPPPENNIDYYQRPPPPPKPHYLVNKTNGGPPPEYPSYNRDNEQFNTNQPQSRMTEQEMRYATYPGRQPHNNNYPVPKPRVPRNLDANKSPSPDQAKLPFKDKMKVFNENTPPKRQTTSRWEREQNGDLNGDTL